MVDVAGQWSCRPSQQEYPLKREIDKEYLKKEDIVSLQQSLNNFDSTYKEVMTFFQEMRGDTPNSDVKGKKGKKK